MTKHEELIAQFMRLHDAHLLKSLSEPDPADEAYRRGVAFGLSLAADCIRDEVCDAGVTR